MAWTSKIAILACALLVCSCVYVVYDLNGSSFDLSDRQAVIVVTDSMDGDNTGFDIDSFPAETLVMIENIQSNEAAFIKIGQVAAYYKNDMLITHRVVGIDTVKHCLIVKGDNVYEQEVIPYEDVVGVVVGTNHLVGAAFLAIKENFVLIGASLAIMTVAMVAANTYRNVPKRDRSLLRRQVAVAFTVTAVAGIALIGVGYSLTTSTENASNTVISGYVVLSQDDYTFVTDGQFKYYSMTGSDGITRYCIIDYGTEKPEYIFRDSGSALAPAPIVNDYWGVKIGSSELLMSKTGFDYDNLVISLQMDSDEDHYFTEFDNSKPQWKYFMKVYYMAGLEETDVHWLWSDGNSWHAIPKEGDSGDCILLDSSKTYKTELYFGAPKVTIMGKNYAGSSTKPLGEDGSAKVIKDGRLKFVFDSTPTITFNKNNGSATGSMENQVLLYNESATLNSNGFSLADHTFVGWNTKADGSGTSYDNGGSITIDRDTTLYAIWS